MAWRWCWRRRVGPHGGRLDCDNYSWRWISSSIFPFGLLSLYMTNRVVEDPPYLAGSAKKRESIDYWVSGCGVNINAALQTCSTRPGERLVQLAFYRHMLCRVGDRLSIFVGGSFTWSTPSSICASSNAAT